MEIQNTGNTGNIEQLEKIYLDVSEWLKFLELKHAGMLAAWIAVFVAIMSVEKAGEIISIMTIICLIGISLSIIPFCPFLNQNDLSGKTIKPFATNAGWLGKTFKEFRTLCPNSEICKGMNIVFESYSDKLVTKEQDIENWIKTL